VKLYRWLQSLGVLRQWTNWPPRRPAGSRERYHHGVVCIICTSSGPASCSLAMPGTWNTFGVADVTDQRVFCSAFCFGLNRAAPQVLSV